MEFVSVLSAVEFTVRESAGVFTVLQQIRLRT